MTENHPSNRSASALGRSGDPIHDDRARVARAREAAEALFAPKPPAAESKTPPSRQSAGPSAREPRVLAPTPPPAPLDQAPNPSSTTRPKRTPAIPRSQFARIRSWVEYGMTIAQVAQVYGVADGVIERILRQD